MYIRFETCDRSWALRFLNQLYPDKNLTDTGVVATLLNFVEQDVIRIPDPKMHGNRVAILPSKNFKKNVEAALKALHNFANT